MKKNLLLLATILLNSLFMGGCSFRTKSVPVSTITLEPTETLIPTATIKSTATFLPTHTPSSLISSSFPTLISTPIPKDIFDNFQGLSGNCRLADRLDTLMKVLYDSGGNAHFVSMADVSIFFDKAGYISGDSIKISMHANDFLRDPKLLSRIVAKVIVEESTSKRYSFYLYDDGTHGDEKADDGIYVNTFNETSYTGIYKFYFKVSGRNTNTGEGFSEECFLATTVDPLPISTTAIAQSGEHQPCTKLEASEPVVVRPENVGGDPDVELGLWASHPKAVSLDDEILAIWPVGSGKKPNVYMRLLDENVRPLGDVGLLFDRVVGGPTALIRKGNNALFSYCGMYDIGGVPEGRPTSALLDSHGHLISEQVRSPTNTSCNSGPLSVWTGSRLLFYSWSTRFGESSTLLDVADADGNSISWRKVPYSGPPAVGHGIVLTTSTKEGGMTIHRLDLEGNDLGESANLEALTYEVDGRIVVGLFKYGYVVPTTDGWMVVALLYAPGIYIAQLAPDGSLMSDPFIIKKDLYFASEFDDVFAYNDGVAILGVSSAFGYSTKTGFISLFISKDGSIQQWDIPKEEPPIFGSFFEHKGRLFLIYQSESADDKSYANQVLIRELNCVP